MDARARCELVPAHGRFARDQERSGAVGDLARHRSGHATARCQRLERSHLLERGAAARCLVATQLAHRGDLAVETARIRSEERRVGKECRSRWSAYHEMKTMTA